MTAGRVTAWAVELQTIHHRLEDALRAARTATAHAARAADLLAHCYAFCGALTDHHQREDAGLFERLLADNPDLAPVIAELKADHVMLARMSAHFADEERRLDHALDRLTTTRSEAIDLAGDGGPPRA